MPRKYSPRKKFNYSTREVKDQKTLSYIEAFTLRRMLEYILERAHEKQQRQAQKDQTQE